MYHLAIRNKLHFCRTTRYGSFSYKKAYIDPMYLNIDVFTTLVNLRNKLQFPFLYKEKRETYWSKIDITIFVIWSGETFLILPGLRLGILHAAEQVDGKRKLICMQILRLKENILRNKNDNSPPGRTGKIPMAYNGPPYSKPKFRILWFLH